MVSCRDAQLMSFSNIPLLSTYFFYSPYSISFLAVLHPVELHGTVLLQGTGQEQLIAPKRCPGSSWLGLHVSSTITTPKTPNPYAGSRMKC